MRYYPFSSNRPWYYITAFWLLSTILMFAQYKPVQTDSNSVSGASGTSFVMQFNDNVGALSNSFEYVYSGTAPGSDTVTIVGCMRGGTCSGTLDSYTGTTSSIRNVNASTTGWNGPYDFYKVTLTWASGDATTTIKVNRLGVMAKSGTSIPNWVIVGGGTNTLIPAAGTTFLITANEVQTTAVAVSQNNQDFVCNPGVQIQQQTAATDLFPITSSTGFSLKNCIIDGNGGVATGFIVHINGASGTNNVVNDRNTVQNWGSNGANGLFTTEGGTNWLFSNNRCILCLDVIYKVHNSNAAPVNNQALNNYFECTANTSSCWRYISDSSTNAFENISNVDNDTRFGVGAAISAGTGSGSLASMQGTYAFNQYTITGTAPINGTAMNAMNNSSFSFNQMNANTKAASRLFELGDCVNGNIIGNYGNATHTAVSGMQFLDFGTAAAGASGCVIAANSIFDLPSNGSVDFGFEFEPVTNTQVGQVLFALNSVLFSTGQTPAGSPLPSCFRLGSNVSAKLSDFFLGVMNFCSGPGTTGVGSNGWLVDVTGGGGATQNDILLAENVTRNVTNGVNVGTGVTKLFLRNNLCLGTCTNPVSNNATAGQVDLGNTSNTQELTLVTGAVTFTFLQPFSKSNNYNCTGVDETTPANAVSFGTKTATSVPVTGTGSDVVLVSCGLGY